MHASAAAFLLQSTRFYVLKQCVEACFLSREKLQLFAVRLSLGSHVHHRALGVLTRSQILPGKPLSGDGGPLPEEPAHEGGASPVAQQNGRGCSHNN